MAFRPLSAVAPAALLRQAKPLKSLFYQAERLEHLQRLVDAQLQPAAREHCKVAAWRDGYLLLIITDGHWATRLRYQQRRLLRQLQQASELASLQRILFKVRPNNMTPRAQGPKRELSNVAAESLLATAEGISNPALRAALERLASRANRKP
ncbi:hypothetical protein IQ22_00188 [Pseudomonas duriflava]|uniref:RNA-binding protein n=1 Tax=Pseudomonas duriflava TaxID=459528 RepID=A0A562QNZ8_9PSED|nr:DciA family protein [Pseudomonas duriflava]TWI58482.1 hypothetical protein IQ22_00188 [Pseudomonas duriflava]